ncbi:hypothetical protein Pan44_26670 [Caulifigura coniformis]|uniref:Uncharacterized protein n=1 Tax=Caulifigura coniformis TaxID=2527983 RepID=A0A517SER1_9PLAN|nr:hypothetical protein [Caulifigura coniformis]QDT54632.1 hypothetical protein Pan44_26670 [Caulifigura coniformis]
MAMARGRRDAEWNRFGWIAARILNAMGAKISDFRKILPFDQEESAPAPEVTGTVDDLNRMMGLT